MPWLYNKHSGDVEHQNEAEWLADQPLAGAVGLVRLPIPDSDTAAQAIAYVKQHFPNDTPPTTSPAQANANATQTVENAVPGLSQVGTFFASLGQANTWIRAGKFVIGGLLLVIGLVHITGADNALASAARKVPLPV